MEKMIMQTRNFADENLKKLIELFPNIVTEVKGQNGKITKAIDTKVLEQEINVCVVNDREERYQFTWPGKRQAMLTGNMPTSSTLRPCIGESTGRDGTQGGFDSENLYIEGDNLEVLKLLQETYLGKVKMIYIDPPYNTGSDFVYSDNYTQEKEEYISGSGQYDENGGQLVQNLESNGRFHTDWLNMMCPRLRLAKNMLLPDGVIFISIDDNEQHNLRKLCDEIFGEQNFVANLVWQKKFSRANDAAYFSTMHDHILCYCKANIALNEYGWKIGLLPRNDELPTGYSNPDNDPRGAWTSVILSAKSGSDSLLYEIETPSGRKVLPPSGRYWSCSKETFNKWKADNRIWFGADGNGTPRKKTFLSEVQQGLRPNTLLLQSEVGNNQEAKQETKALFDGVGLFDGPKPIRLLKTLITIANVGNDEIVLDFFSGSATTAHAVMQLNAEDGGNRKFIMVQLPEETPEKSEARKAGYKNICEIGKERIRRAGAKIKQETGADIDYGFRVLKCDSSNMKSVYYAPADTEQEQLDILADNIKEGRTGEDLLFQVMLDLGVPLSSTIESIEVAGQKIFDVGQNYLLACFDLNVTESGITEIAKRQPAYFVMRDRSMANDTVAANFEQIFRTYSPDTVRKVL